MDDITVVVADAHRLFAECLGKALDEEADMSVRAVRYEAGRHAVVAAIATQPSVLLYDFWMPGISGPAAVRYLATWAPNTQVLLLSWLHGPYQVRDSYDAGASGMLAKTVGLEDLVTAIRDVVAGQSLRCAEPITARVAKAFTGHDPSSCWSRLKKLTPRELTVLDLLNSGRSVPEVAESLGVARSTAKNHVYNILKKTVTGSTAEAIELAQHEGLVG